MSSVYGPDTGNYSVIATNTLNAGVAKAASTVCMLTVSDNRNILKGLKWSTTIPNGQFAYVARPDETPAMKGWLTDEIYDMANWNDGGHLVCANVSGYFEFDFGEARTFKQVSVSARIQTILSAGDGIPGGLTIEAFIDGAWVVLGEKKGLQASADKIFVFGVTGKSGITATKLRVYVENANFFALNEISALTTAPTGSVDGTLVDPSVIDPTTVVNLSVQKPYTIFQEEDTAYPDTNNTELTDGAKGSTNATDAAWSGCSLAGTTTGKVVDRWPLRSVVIDLQGTKSITKIQANFLTDNGKSISQPIGVRTFASMDGENWMPLSRLVNINTGTAGINTYGWHATETNGNSMDLTKDVNSIVTAKYVRFDIEKYNYNLMDEVEVFG
ncbi:MAG: hypothetical protein RR977_02415, partial [Oscillospiraceae bacterium]